MAERDGALSFSPLDAEHRSLGAKMAPFAGWEMPISYEGTLAEHANVRERAGIFDVSHLGKVLVAGSRARDLLDEQLTNRMSDLQPGHARYTLILEGDAGIIDDLIVYAITKDEMLVVPNAANAGEVEHRLAAAAPADLDVRRLEWSTLAVQGPAAPGIVGEMFPPAKDLGYMQIARHGAVVIARSGYTGERGYEVFTTAADAPAVWRELLDAVTEAGGGPCGLAARDTLRLEMGYPLHGNDIDRSTTPAEAGLMWAVRLKGRSFPGHDVLVGAAPARSLIGLRMLDKVIPRAGSEVLVDGRSVGRCTSGTFSPTLRVGIALAYVEAGSVGPGDKVEVDVRGKRGTATVVDPPFVDRSPK